MWIRNNERRKFCCESDLGLARISKPRLREEGETNAAVRVLLQLPSNKAFKQGDIPSKEQVSCKGSTHRVEPSICERLLHHDSLIHYIKRTILKKRIMVHPSWACWDKAQEVKKKKGNLAPALSFSTLGGEMKFACKPGVCVLKNHQLNSYSNHFKLKCLKQRGNLA